ncbi:MAG TPA: hypothetical protein VHD83_11920 [Puia sp.]|nr:hypothetical protein [Puia sp.]
MIPQEHQLLWSKIQSFSLDDRTAQVTFSGKLAASRNWTMPFALQAIEEYRKFIFLCCISSKGAAPSGIVDEVWHLHLTYTQSYWIDLCKNTLGRDLHHFPSKGGEEEDSRHQQWYRETLRLYRSVFGVDAPSNIWPAPNQAVLLLEDPPFTLDAATILAMIGLVLLPFIFIAAMYHTWSPFDLGGPHFLAFFPIYAACLILAYIIYRRRIIKGEVELATASLPMDASVFQVTNFLYGDHRALQTGIVDLVKKGLLEIPGYNQFVVKKSNYRSDPRDTNPLMPAYAREEEGSMLNYDTLMATWYNSESFSHPALEALNKFRRRPESFLRTYVFHVAILGMLLARSTQGILNDKPIILLLLEGVVFIILFMFIAGKMSKSAVVARKVRATFKQRVDNIVGPNDRFVSQFAMEGTQAIDHWAEGAVLSGLFLVYTPVWYRNGVDMSTNTSGNCGSSGSSCSGGSSCGGGSGCGGCSGS